MNQLSKIYVCRSVLRKNLFARWSLKPISSSLISNNPTSLNLKTRISKFHHTFSNPPLIFSTPGNQSRKFSGEPAAVSGDPAVAQRNFDDDNLDDEFYGDDFDLDDAISEIIEETGDARDHIDLATLPPLEAIEFPLELFQALLKKLGLDESDVYEDGNYPPHLESYRKKLSLMKAYVEDTVAYGKYAARIKKIPSWREFTAWYDAGGMPEGESPAVAGDTSPAAQDHVTMPVDDASAVVSENLADINYPGIVNELGVPVQ